MAAVEGGGMETGCLWNLALTARVRSDAVPLLTRARPTCSRCGNRFSLDFLGGLLNEGRGPSKNLSCTEVK